jgi:hypothetical protein
LHLLLRLHLHVPNYRSALALPPLPLRPLPSLASLASLVYFN